ncbi:MAG: DUF1232 domain-containing protein [Nitrospirae bacterium]|nr:DUF1232 domain-containing protein [Nitrospirota bacterium]
MQRPEVTVNGRWKAWVAERKKDTYALYLASREPRVPLAAKVIAVLVVAYLLSPVDLIPDFIPVLGYMDDMVLVPLGIAIAIRCIPPGIWQECRSQACDRLASTLPRSRAASIVIAIVWAGMAALMIFFALGMLDRL